MKTMQQSEKFRQKRKILLLLPLFIVPLLTLLFWALGGGKSDTTANTGSGLNTQLPDAKLKSDKGFDKLSFYQQALKDSAKMLEEKKTDPYWLKFGGGNDTVVNQNKERDFLSPGNFTGIDTNEAKVYSKLEQLNKTLAQSRQAGLQRQQTGSSYLPENALPYSNDANKLEAMMNRMKANKAEDPELKQLNEMLNKIAAIEHPEQVNDTVQRANKFGNSDQPSVRIHKKEKRVPVSMLQAPSVVINTLPKTQVEQNGFYGENSASSFEDTVESNTIAAVVSETQTLTSGATVKLSLSQDIVIKGITVSKGGFLFGTATLSNDRLLISIHSIRSGYNLLPVSLNVYDIDGLEGIYVPGSISLDAARQSADRATGGLGTTILNPSLGAQAASAGIETAKSLLRKKIKLVKVSVTAGYQVLLKDSHSTY